MAHRIDRLRQRRDDAFADEYGVVRPVDRTKDDHGSPSPPSRQTVSISRTTATSRSATIYRQGITDIVAEQNRLTFLKRSRSRNSTATWLRLRSAAISA